MMPHTPTETREDFLNRLVATSKQLLEDYKRSRGGEWRSPGRELLDDLSRELAEPDTSGEFLPQGLSLARYLAELALPLLDPGYPEKQEEIRVDFEKRLATIKEIQRGAGEEIFTRLWAIDRLHRPLGLPEFEAASTLQGYSVAQGSYAADMLIRISSDPVSAASVPPLSRLAHTLAIARTIPSFADPASKLAVSLLQDTATDVFERFELALFHYTNETRPSITPLLPVLMDEMLQTDAPKAAKAIELAIDDNSNLWGSRGMEPVAAHVLAPKRSQIAEYLIGTEQSYNDYDALPRSLALPRLAVRGL